MRVCGILVVMYKIGLIRRFLVVPSATTCRRAEDELRTITTDTRIILHLLFPFSFYLAAISVPPLCSNKTGSSNLHLDYLQDYTYVII